MIMENFRKKSHLRCGAPDDLRHEKICVKPIFWI